MVYENILFSVENGIGRITLNRPDKLNSLTLRMHSEFRDALGRLQSEGARVALLTGAGRGFCAGQDLGERLAAPDIKRVDLGESIEKNYKPLVLAIRNLPMPVVAAVNGIAAGAGANIALACDIVIAARSAAFVQSFCKLGLVPDAGGTWTLPRLVGTARALGLTLLGDKLPAEEAAAWGLIWRCVGDAELAAVVESIAARLAIGPTRGLSRTKIGIYGSAELSLVDALDAEGNAQRELGLSDDYGEGLAAFAAKRPPQFSGK